MQCECKSIQGGICCDSATHEVIVCGEKKMLCENCIERCVQGAKITPLEPEPESEPGPKTNPCVEAAKIRCSLEQQLEKLRHRLARVKNLLMTRTEQMNEYRHIIDEYEGKAYTLQRKTKEIDQHSNN